MKNFFLKLKNLIGFLFITSSLTGFGQTLSMSDIKVISEEINTQIKGVVLDPSTGVKGRGVISVGRNLIYQYDVPEDWYPYDDIRQELVKNLIESGKNKLYVQGEVDVSYYYFKNNRIIKSVNIDWRELRFKLGD